MTPFRESLRGILGITFCNLFFLIADTLVKLASDELPLGEILFVRGIFATLLLTPLVVVSGAWRQARLLAHWAMVLRTAAEIGAALLFLLALFNIPIANANAILQVVPLMVAATAAIFLGEEVGWKRWAAIALGFVGVLIVIRPGLGGFDAYSLVALAAMVFITIRDIATRIMPFGLPALLVSLATAVAVGLSGLLLGTLSGEEWSEPSTRSLGLIFGAVFFLIGGYLTAVDFMRHGNIAVVAPFRYTVVVWAMVVGFIVWRELPDLMMLVGTAIIIASGGYTFYRERRLTTAAR